MNELKPLLDLLGGQLGWLPTVITWIAAIKLAMTFFETTFAHWAADKLNEIAATESSDDDDYLRQLFAMGWYRFVAFTMRLLGFRLPTLADLERAIRLQKEAVVDAGAALPAQRNPSATSSRSFLPLLLIGFMLFASAPVFTGCTLLQNTPKETLVYNTFKSSWTVAHTAYGVWCERVVQGKVSAEQEAAVDSAWNKYRAVFKVTFALANANWSAPTDASLADAEAQLTNLIRNFSTL